MDGTSLFLKQLVLILWFPLLDQLKRNVLNIFYHISSRSITNKKRDRLQASFWFSCILTEVIALYLAIISGSITRSRTLKHLESGKFMPKIFYINQLLYPPFLSFELRPKDRNAYTFLSYTSDVLLCLCCFRPCLGFIILDLTIFYQVHYHENYCLSETNNGNYLRLWLALAGR